MLKKINKNKIYPFLFVVISLMIFLAFFGFYLIIYFNNLYKNIVIANNDAIISKEYAKKISADISDPYITKMYNPKDAIKEPILRTEDPVFGFIDTPITIFIYSDYDCVYCAKQLEMIKTSIKKYKSKAKLIWKDYPESDFNSVSYKSAIAARCAQEQGLFWEYNESLFLKSAELNKDIFKKIATEVGLNINSWQACLKKDSIKKIINDNIFEADALLINGVPFVYINNQEYLGGIEAKDLEELFK